MSEGDSTCPLPCRGRNAIGKPGDDAARQGCGRLAPGALDGLLADLFQPRQVVDAGPADDAKHGTRHDFSQVSFSRICSTILRRNNQALSASCKRAWNADQKRPGKAPIDHRCLPQHECARHQPGNVGEYQPAPWRGHAGHADQHALRGDAARADRVHGPRRLARSRPAAVERVAISPRHPQGPARSQCRGPRPPDLFDDPCHHGPGNSADPLHDRVRRRRHHPRRALCDLRHPGAFGARRARAGRQAGVPAGAPRHDCDRRHRFRKRCGLPSKSKRWPGNITAACRSGRRACCRRPRSKTFSAASQDTVPPGNRSDRPTSPRSRLRSSARR